MSENYCTVLSMKIQNMPIHTRPREKLLQLGGNGLTDAELLAILLQTGYKGKDVLEVAKRILHNKNLKELFSTDTLSLQAIKGIGTSKAVLLAAVQALAIRLHEADSSPLVNRPQDLVELNHHLLDMKREHLLGYYLNARHQLVAQETLSIGTLDSSLIHPREVFSPALQHRSAGVILVHNHPSGNPQPSPEDIEVTEKLVEGGELLSIPLLDHIIIAKEGWYSFRQEKLL